MLSEISFTIWEMSFHIFSEMSFSQIGQKKACLYTGGGAAKSGPFYQEPAIPAFSIPIPILRLVLRLVDSDTDTDTRKSENFDSDSDTDTKVKQVL